MKINLRQFNFSSNAKRGSYKKPFLQQGDIVHIGKNSLNIASEVVQDLISPVTSVYGIYKIYD